LPIQEANVSTMAAKAIFWVGKLPANVVGTIEGPMSKPIVKKRPEKPSVRV